MRAGRVSDIFINRWLADAQATPMWLGLLAEDPYAVTDPLAVEVGGPAYRRPKVSWEKIGRVLRSSASCSWLGLEPGTRVTFIVGFDAPFNGNVLLSSPTPRPIDFPRGGSWTLPKHDFYLGLDAMGSGRALTLTNTTALPSSDTPYVLF